MTVERTIRILAGLFILASPALGLPEKAHGGA